MGPDDLVSRVKALESDMAAIEHDLRGQERDDPGVMLRVDRVERDLDRLMSWSKWIFGTVVGLVIAEFVRFLVAFKLGGPA